MALNHISLKPSQVLVFEDSTAGISAGVCSGCDVVAIRHEFNAKNDLSKAIRAIHGYNEMFV